MSGTFHLLIHSRLHEALQKEARSYLVPLAKTLSHPSLWLPKAGPALPLESLSQLAVG